MTDEQTPMVPQKGSDEYVDYVINLSRRGVIRQGVLNEPRVYFDEIVVTPSQTVDSAGNPDAFLNGEQFPVRLTHLIAALRFLDNADPQAIDNQFNIQSIGLALRFHDQYYMSPGALLQATAAPAPIRPIPIPLWGNKCVGQGEVGSFATASWDFVANGQPFILSARDTLVVDAQLRDAVDPQNPAPVSVAFTGFGALSRRPYLMQGTRLLADLQQLAIQAQDYRNDGMEPIIITDMSVNVGAELGSVDPRGAIERLRLNVRQVGNGTNAQWFKGPSTPALPLMQASLTGVTTGRAVVHQLPGDGVIWAPGEGITVTAAFLGGAAQFNSVLCLGMAGYIMVQ